MANQFANTPLIKPVKAGTFITFPSTGEDLTLSFNNSNKKLVFSKFALLNIPPIQDATNNQNTIQFGNIEGHFTIGLSPATPAPEGDRIDLSESLQNYVLNMETLLSKSSNYDSSLYRTTSERIFFKWLKEIGALRFREAVSTEKASTVTAKRFVEEDENTNPSAGDLYDRVVKYIGEIDIDGNNHNSTNATKEVYIYIPTANGSTPVVMFESYADANYFPGLTVRKEIATDIEYIAGRDASDDPSPAGLTVKAVYDMDTTYGSYTYLVNGGVDPIWFDSLAPNGPNAYFTDPIFEISDNDEIERTNPSTLASITYKRSKLDGISIDWEKSDYKYFEDNPSAIAFNEYNASEFANSFRFNAILIYYDLFDPADETTRETNLYGVLFIDSLEVLSAGASRVKTFSKIKPNKIIGEQGNGYGVRLNLKFDVNADNVIQDVEVSVNDYNTFSMQLFSELMNQLQIQLQTFEQVQITNQALQTAIGELENIVLSDTNKNELLSKIATIEEILKDVVPNSSLLGLIAANTQQINNIIAGQTSVDINLALNLQAFDGLSLDLLNGVLYFKNKRQKYPAYSQVILKVDVPQSVNITNIVALGTHDTLVYHKNPTGSLIAQANVYIYVNDQQNKWQNGQSMKIMILDEIDFGPFGVVIMTDAGNQFGNSAPYQQLIGTIPIVERKQPIFEIVCVDSATYTFIVTQS